MASASDLAQAVLANNADVSPLGGLTKFAAELLRRGQNTSIWQSINSAYTAPMRAYQGEMNPSLGIDDSGNYVDLNANKSTQEGLNLAGNMLIDSLPIAPSGAGTVGMIKTQRGIFPETRSDVSNLSDRLIKLLNQSGTNVNWFDKSQVSPSTYHYIDIPDHAGESYEQALRISDHADVHSPGDWSVAPGDMSFEEMLQKLRDNGINVANRVKPPPKLDSKLNALWDKYNSAEFLQPRGGLNYQSTSGINDIFRNAFAQQFKGNLNNEHIDAILRAMK